MLANELIQYFRNTSNRHGYKNVEILPFIFRTEVQSSGPWLTMPGSLVDIKIKEIYYIASVFERFISQNRAF